MGCCNKCSKGVGIVLLIAGLIFLLQNLAVWDFWGIQWYTVAFVLLGVSYLGCSSCTDCQACCSTETKGPKKKK